MKGEGSAGKEDRRRGPPRLAEILLGASLPTRHRDPLLGDLREAFLALQDRTTRAHARRWYLLQVVKSVIPNLALKVRGQRNPAPSRRRAPMEGLLRDLRFGVRALAKQPGYTAISILAFALGIGLCTTMFSIIYGIYGRGLGVPESDRLVVVSRTRPSRINARMDVPQHDLYDWREQQRSFQGLAGVSGGSMNLSDVGVPERYAGAFVTANTFDVLKVDPILGRTFRAGEDGPGAPLTVMVGHDVWRIRYDSDPEVVGRVVRVNGEQGTIIGVMPEGFLFPSVQQLWVPLRDQRADNPRGEGPMLTVFGRLRDGVTVEEARLEMSVIGERLAAAYPESNEGVGIIFNTILDLAIGDEALPVMLAMQIATVFVLFIACFNVANLLLARATLRGNEAAIRAAMGANRLRVALPFLSEAALLSLAGAVLGVGIAYFGIDVVNQATVGVGKPYFMVVTIDLPILWFVVAITFLAALVSGMAPALRVGRADVGSILKDEGRSSSGVRANRLSRLLVVCEIAMSCALLVGAGLMVKSVANLRAQDYTFDTDNIFTARVGLLETDFPQPEDRLAFIRDLLENLSAIPGVDTAALTNRLPARGTASVRFEVEGETYRTDRDHPVARLAVATPGLFAAFDAGILRGTDLPVDDDRDSPPVVVVNQGLADRFFPGEDPVGRRLRVTRSGIQPVWSTIIGVVPNMRMEGFDPGDSDPAGLYLPFRQSDRSLITLVVRVAEGDPLAIGPQVQAAVRAVHPDTPIYQVRDMGEVIRQETWVFDLFGGLFIVFGMAALFLASVGLYGVISFSVNRRVQEMGIRMALGANAKNVMRVVVGEGSSQIATGLVIGLGLALATSSVLSAAIFNVPPRDPGVFAATVGAIIVVGLGATYFPARRVTRVDPVVALSHGGTRHLRQP